LCNPNNPTGTVYRGTAGRVAAFCRENGLFLVADEVYRELVYDGHAATSVLSLPGCEDVAVLVDSLSKRYSACGIRLGCLATRNPGVSGAALRMAQGRLSPPGLAQLVALGATELGPDYAEGIVREYQMRRDVLFEGLSRIPGCSCGSRRAPSTSWRASRWTTARTSPPGSSPTTFEAPTVMVALPRASTPPPARPR
jgi:aspartate aminotransferase